MPDLTALFSELIRFETELWNAVDARLRGDCDLPLTQFEPMQIIGRRQRCRVQDIARAVAITVGGASQAVDRLESAGLCARRANPSDRRSSIVELTPKGMKLLGIAAPVFDRELDRLLRAPLPGTDLLHLADALSTLRRSAAAQAGSPATPAASPPPALSPMTAMRPGSMPSSAACPASQTSPA